MMKDLMFKMRLDKEDKERLDILAEEYSAPAATVVRILIKERADEIVNKLQTEKEARDPTRREILSLALLADVEPVVARKALDEGVGAIIGDEGHRIAIAMSSMSRVRLA